MNFSVLFAGMTMGLSLIAAIGAQNAFVLRQGLRDRHVFAVCLTCAVSDALLIVLGVTSFGKIAAVLPGLDPVMRYGGAAFLIWYGAKSLRSALRSTEALTAGASTETSGIFRTLLACLAITWLNPHVYLDTVVLLGTISTQFPGAELLLRRRRDLGVVPLLLFPRLWCDTAPAGIRAAFGMAGSGRGRRPDHVGDRAQADRGRLSETWRPLPERGAEMYLPEHFKEIGEAEIASVIRAAPLACIVAHTEAGLIANHLPLLMASDGALVGHVALANDMHRLIADGQEVLAIFRGEDGYVSPNFYPSKADHHRHVPTWNYQVVHVYGEITFQHDERAKRAAVGLLTRDHERRLNGDKAWRMADAPADFIVQMLAGIVAFRIAVRRVLAKSKLSQNREARDYQGVVEGLRASGNDALAERMALRVGAGRGVDAGRPTAVVDGGRDPHRSSSRRVSTSR